MTEEQNNKRAAAWAYIQAHSQFTVPELSSAIEMDLEQCRTTVNRCVIQGYLRHVGGPGVPGRPKRFTMVPDSKPRIGKGAFKGDVVKSQKTKTGRQKMWNSMKISRVFTADSLCVTAGVCKKTADEFIRKLSAAGYVAAWHRIDTRRPNHEVQGQSSSYRLIRDTGRLSPIVRKTGCWDQNEQTLHPFNKGAGNEQRVA